MNRWKNKLDEMQEQKLLKIEHNGVWLAFWGLFATIIIQIIIGKENILRSIAGEWIVFMLLSGCMLAACIKNGIWDRRLSPNPKTNASVSLIAGIATGLILFALFYGNSHSITLSAVFGLCFSAGTFAVLFLVMSILSSLYKRRVNKLEADPGEPGGRKK